MNLFEKKTLIITSLYLYCLNVVCVFFAPNVSERFCVCVLACHFSATDDL